MRAIIKREFKNYFKNLIYWGGVLFIMFQLYQILNPYLQLHYFETEEQLEAVEPENAADADITEGYVLSSEEERFEQACKFFSLELKNAFGITEEETEQLIEEVQGQNLSIKEMSDALLDQVWTNYENNYTGENVYGFSYWYDRAEIHKGNLEEVNTYIHENLEEHSFSWYFARKYADFCGLFMGFFSAVLLAFLYIRDTKKDTYELLHTKPISSKGYVLGKVGGGLLSMFFAWGILTLVFGILCEFYGRNHGFPVNFLDFLVTAIIYVVPNMLMITCIYTATALIFKNPLPAVPGIFLYMIYSNMGSRNAERVYGYYGRPLAIMVRFPGRFFETTPPPLAAMNQIFLLLASVVLLAVAAMIWKRRRVY